MYVYNSSKISDWPGSKAVKGTVNILLQRGADPNPADGSAPILAALKLYAEDLVLLLLKAGSSPDCRDAYNRTPLIIATTLGMARVVAALLEILDTHTDLEIKDFYGRSAITEATRRNKNQILKLLTRDSDYCPNSSMSCILSDAELVKVPERFDDICSVCMVPLLNDSQDHYSCQQCASFKICRECEDWQVTCLHPGHEIVLQHDEPG
ncbi:ankyrin [Penicillium malachiteum]|uniref:ankyrin n=1 Tax=Penicillium malachiteum TaxID=1324776 RepID=UPI002549417D|nr:ankyrin [Penicillium malachiteum]KAJ5726633.1 ankyrin [Penicillium malachiteum]